MTPATDSNTLDRQLAYLVFRLTLGINILVHGAGRIFGPGAGAFATTTAAEFSNLGARQPLAGLRGRVHAFRGMSLIVTYHPAFLLRDPRQKKEAWADLQIAMKELGLKAPAKG